MSDNLPDIALANVALDNINTKGENVIKGLTNDRITAVENQIDSESQRLSGEISQVSQNKVNLNFDNINDTAKTLIDNRATNVTNTIFGNKIKYVQTLPTSMVNGVLYLLPEEE